MVSADSEGATSPPLPFMAPDTAWRPLDQRWEQGLQAKLDQALRKEQLWQTLIDQRKMAVGLVDLTDPALPRFAQVNGNTMMYAASLPKVAILLAACQGFEDGSITETPRIRADLIEMIRRSDNFAASQMVARIGLEKIERVIVDPRYRFYDTTKGGGIWVGGSLGEIANRTPNRCRTCSKRRRSTRFAGSTTYWLTAGSSTRRVRGKC